MELSQTEVDHLKHLHIGSNGQPRMGLNICNTLTQKRRRNPGGVEHL